MTSPRAIREGANRAGALANPTRLAIALEIARRPYGSIDQLAERVGRDQSLVSRHCTRLHDAGLLTRQASGHPHYWLSDYGKALLALVMDERAH